MNLTGALMGREKYQGAIDCSLESEPLYEKLGDGLSLASVHANLSILYRKKNDPGDLDLALGLIKKARDVDLHEKNLRGLIRDYRIMFKLYKKRMIIPTHQNMIERPTKR